MGGRERLSAHVYVLYLCRVCGCVRTHERERERERGRWIERERERERGRRYFLF